MIYQRFLNMILGLRANMNPDSISCDYEIDFNVLASFTVFIFALCFSIWLTFVMHLWSTFSSVVWKIYQYFNVLHSLFLCLRYCRCAEMSPRRIARVELDLRRIVPSPSWRRRVGRAESAAPSCPRPERNRQLNNIRKEMV